MARDYGRIKTAFWTSRDLRDLPRGVRETAAYLLTGPHTTALGCFRLPLGYVAEDMGLSIEEVRADIAALTARGWLIYDEKEKFVWIKKFLAHNEPESENVWKHVATLLKGIPRCVAFYNAIIDTLPEPFRKGIERVSEPYRTPEPEPEPYSEAKASGADAPLADDPPKPIDLQKLVWDTGVEFLKSHGLTERQARTLLGKWTKTHGPPAVLDALRRAEVAASPEPVSYITKVLENGRKTGFTSVEDAFAGLEVRAASAVERASGTGWREGGYVDPASDVWPAEEDARGGGDLVRAVG